MTKYRKLPVVVDAFRLGLDDYPEWFKQAEKIGKVESGTVYSGDRPYMSYAKINTLEGLMRAQMGDYIVRGIEGEIYPVEPNIFVRTYKKVEDYNNDY